ncbi:uncharacterized protein LOC133889389 [Phragmites australis]|uniref:uncharacterized protein LOC133889389 n=1 Tax=Phragmites australis TaxID=29695 RepID=UPI002D7811A3|nr:uncharacterized protein LOC133889389 [Phragmites australis]
MAAGDEINTNRRLKSGIGVAKNRAAPPLYWEEFSLPNGNIRNSALSNIRARIASFLMIKVVSSKGQGGCQILTLLQDVARKKINPFGDETISDGWEKEGDGGKRLREGSQREIASTTSKTETERRTAVPANTKPNRTAASKLAPPPPPPSQHRSSPSPAKHPSPRRPGKRSVPREPPPPRWQVQQRVELDGSSSSSSNSRSLPSPTPRRLASAPSSVRSKGESPNPPRLDPPPRAAPARLAMAGRRSMAARHSPARPRARDSGAAELEFGAET